MSLRQAVAWAALAFAAAQAIAAEGGPAAAPDTSPRRYALVSAVGSQLTFTVERMRTGSHLPPYNRGRVDAADDVLDRLVLYGLEGAVAKLDPSSQRVHLSVKVPPARTDAASIEDAALAKVVEKLRGLRERGDWDRIVLAIPAFRPLEGNAMPGRIQGLGVFFQPLCALWDDCDFKTTVQSGGQRVSTPDGRTVSSSRFVAPYISLRILILDPKTLAVLESQEVYGHEKFFDPMSDTLDMKEMIPRKLLAAKMIELVEVTTREAVARTELRGVVDVREKGPIAPGDAK